MDNYFSLVFDNVRNKNKFFFDIEKYRSKRFPKGSILGFEFAKSVMPCDFEAMQIVLLCCLIGEIEKKGYTFSFKRNTQELKEFLKNELFIHYYFGRDKIDHVSTRNDSVLNLWRVVEDKIVMYSRKVHEFLKRKYFADRDLSAFEGILSEMYCNVYDHANADGVAFSYIKYCEDTGKIFVAVCDFGEGIARTIRPRYPSFRNDKDALVGALRKGVSAQTKSNNKGLGLDDIASFLGEGDALRIISNSAFFIQIGENVKKVYDLGFDFKGTLLYFDILVQNLEKEDFVGNFCFDE